MAGVIGQYKECFIHDTPWGFIITNEHGRTIGQSQTISGCEGLIEEYREKNIRKEVKL